MKKLFVICSFIALLWLAKMSYDQIQSARQMNTLQSQITALEQSNANLNDHLVALQRQPQSAQEKADSDSKKPSENNVTQGLNPLLVIRQQLQLVQFALQQQQEIYAFEQLTQLQKQIVQYEIAPALQQSLVQGMSKDLQAIQQYHDLRQSQLDQAHLLFKAADQQFNGLLANQTQQYQPAPQHFWNNWFKVESVQQPKTELMNQRLVIKEAQIRLLFAKQAFDAGLFDEYQQNLTQTIALLQQAPAFNQQALRKLLEKAKQLQIAAVPTLSTMALLN